MVMHPATFKVPGGPGKPPGPPGVSQGPRAPEVAGRRPTLGPRALGPPGGLGSGAPQCYIKFHEAVLLGALWLCSPNKAAAIAASRAQGLGGPGLSRAQGCSGPLVSLWPQGPPGSWRLR